MTPTIPTAITAAIHTARPPVCAHIYHLGTLTDRITAVRAALPEHARLYYAMKANSRPELAATAAQHCHGIEIASPGELATATAAKARHLIYGGPAKTDTALTAAVTNPTPVTINVEGIAELRRLDHIARHHDTIADIALRVNRATPTPTGSHHMTGTPTPFGIDAAQLDDTVALTRRLPGLRLTGLHLHAVSNNLDAAAHAAFVIDGLDYAAATAHRYRIDWQTVNLGGGIGVDPVADTEFDLDEFADRLRHAPESPFTPVFELGRYLAAETGWYACEVIDLKTTHGRRFAVVRGGTHHFRLPAAWGYSHPAAVHQVERWPYAWERPEFTDTTVDVTGELCTPRDVLCRDLPVERLRVGDVLVFARTGAYGWDISHHDFLSHPHPDVVVLG